ncbi:obscurin isoform X38 [Biomphalaria pfeifferi]|uniref:Obscurin isoform X38 n=1 Tax=Biomphalaria pfeifferi TaxID=112525 RepID=A0AAD8FJM1_BIOPF|nr:obscurin isoform X38 [Biomphalaria pfeifferi]
MRLFCVSFCILGLSFECECYRENLVVKVGENATIRGTFNHAFNGPPKLKWYKKGEYKTYSKCYPDLTCDDFSPKTSTTIRHLEQRTFEFEFVIKNVKENDKGEWYLEYLGQMEVTKPLYICNISLLECYRENLVVKVGENATIRGTFNHAFNGLPKLKWYKKGEYKTYSKCYPDLTCDDFSPKTSTTIRHLEQRTFEFEFVIKNVKENDKGEWYLEYLGQMEVTKPLYICNISLLECYRENLVVKVGENATIRGTFNHAFNGPPKLKWYKKGEYKTYSKCYPDLTCDDFSPKTSTTIRHLEQRTFEFEFVIKNVKENDKGEWYLEYLGQMEVTKPLYICNISLLEINIESPNPAPQKGQESSPHTDSVKPDSINSTIVIVTVEMTYLYIFFKFDKYVLIEKCKMYSIVNARGSKSCKERKLCQDKHITDETLKLVGRRELWRRARA